MFLETLACQTSAMVMGAWSTACISFTASLKMKRAIGWLIPTHTSWMVDHIAEQVPTMALPSTHREEVSTSSNELRLHIYDWTVILALDRDSPQSAGKNVNPPVQGDELPAIQASSDIMWLYWKVYDNPKGPHYFLSTCIVNAQTQAIVSRAIRETIPEVQSYPPWGGYDFDTDTPEGEAILGKSFFPLRKSLEVIADAFRLSECPGLQLFPSSAQEDPWQPLHLPSPCLPLQHGGTSWAKYSLHCRARASRQCGKWSGAFERAVRKYTQLVLTDETPPERSRYRQPRRQ